MRCPLPCLHAPQRAQLLITQHPHVVRTEWRAMTGLRTEFVVSEGSREDSHSGKIDDALLSDLGIPNDALVYLCGPPPMEDAVAGSLNKIGITGGQIIREQ